MSNQRLLELVRKEDIILFAGAGMSMYAGYPSGVALAKTMYDNLTDDEKREMDITDDLPKLTNEIFYLKNGSKNYLFEILKREFQKEPTSTETHDLLARIPHFKTIITTNYDTLFESTNKNLDVIRKSKDYPLADPKKQWLFKVHGDLSDTARIILTKTDYDKYFSTSQEDTVFWNAIKDRLASHHVVFVGYSMEDPNTTAIIDKITMELGENRKEMFFIAPTVKAPKRKFLESNKISVIRGTGESFVKECYDDLKMNYVPGLSKGVGSADVALNFGIRNNIQLSVEKGKQGNVLLTDYKQILGEIGTNKIKFELTNIPSERAKYINDALLGKNLDDVILNRNEISTFSHFFEGIRLRDESDLQSLTFKKTPNFSGDIDILFENGLEFENLYVEIFGAKPDKDEVHFKIFIFEFEVTIKLKFLKKPTQGSDINIEIKPKIKIKSTSSGLEFYRFLYEIVSNKNFNVLIDGKSVYKKSAITNFKENDLDAAEMVAYFQNLKKIEKYYPIKFTDICLSKMDKIRVRNILAYKEKTIITEKFSGVTLKSSIQTETEKFIEDSEKDKLMVWSEKQKLRLNLHGFDFIIGYPHHFVTDAFVVNHKKLKAGKTNSVKIESRSKTFYIQFSDEENVINE